MPPRSRDVKFVGGGRRIRAKRGERRAMPEADSLRQLSEAKVAEGEGFEPPVEFPPQWFSRPFMGGRSNSSSQFTSIKRPFHAHGLGVDWGLSGQKADSLIVARRTHPILSDEQLALAESPVRLAGTDSTPDRFPSTAPSAGLDPPVSANLGLTCGA